MRVTMADGRQLTGTLLAFDKVRRPYLTLVRYSSYG
jgi:small nuclear ribonucleoprotein (snRNP)-like protein